MMPSADHHFAKTPDTHTHMDAQIVGQLALTKTTWIIFLQLDHTWSRSNLMKSQNPTANNTYWIRIKSNSDQIYDIYDLCLNCLDIRMMLEWYQASSFISFLICAGDCGRPPKCRAWMTRVLHGPAVAVSTRVQPGWTGRPRTLIGVWWKRCWAAGCCWAITENLSIYQSINPSTNININQSNQSNQSLDWFTGTF